MPHVFKIIPSQLRSEIIFWMPGKPNLHQYLLMSLWTSLISAYCQYLKKKNQINSFISQEHKVVHKCTHTPHTQQQQQQLEMHPWATDNVLEPPRSLSVFPWISRQAQLFVSSRALGKRHLADDPTVKFISNTLCTIRDLFLCLLLGRKKERLLGLEVNGIHPQGSLRFRLLPVNNGSLLNWFLALQGDLWSPQQQHRDQAQLLPSWNCTLAVPSPSPGLTRIPTEEKNKNFPWWRAQRHLCITKMHRATYFRKNCSELLEVRASRKYPFTADSILISNRGPRGPWDSEGLSFPVVRLWVVSLKAIYEDRWMPSVPIFSPCI